MDDPACSTRERALRAAALGGDAGAWAALFAAAFDTVHGYARWRCGGRDDLTDDVTQEAWLTAVKQLRRFDPERGRFAGWVCGIAANVARKHVRAKLRHRTRVRPLVAVPEPTTGDPTATADGEAVAVALAELHEQYEAALRLKYFDRLSVTDMAARTGESVKAVESRLTRARQAFREAYRRTGGDTP